jgi:hypothetical protein
MLPAVTFQSLCLPFQFLPGPGVKPGGHCRDLRGRPLQ